MDPSDPAAAERQRPATQRLPLAVMAARSVPRTARRPAERYSFSRFAGSFAHRRAARWCVRGGGVKHSPHPPRRRRQSAGRFRPMAALAISRPPVSARAIAQHLVAALPLDDHGIDAGLVQQLSEQQARRTGADDCDMGSGRRPVTPPGCCCPGSTCPSARARCVRRWPSVPGYRAWVRRQAPPVAPSRASRSGQRRGPG